MVKNSTQQTERLVYRLGLRSSNSMQNGGLHPSSSNTPYSSNDLDKEGYSAPFIPSSTSYVNYSKQYFSKSDASKSSANADDLSTHQRSVTSTSLIVATYDYSPFGQLIATSGTPELSPIQFSSEVFDRETALTYYNHRYYNPTDGRWLSRDPAGESASLNLYAFVNNSPNYRTDYLGLFNFVKGEFKLKNTMLPLYNGTKSILDLPIDSILFMLGSNSDVLGMIESLFNSQTQSSNQLFRMYLAKYLSGEGGSVKFDIPLFYKSELIYASSGFPNSILQALRRSVGFMSDNGIRHAYVSFDSWESVSANSLMYIPILGRFKYGLEVIEESYACGYEFNIYLYDEFDFDMRNFNSVTNVINNLYSWPYVITEMLKMSAPFSIIGIAQGKYFSSNEKIFFV